MARPKKTTSTDKAIKETNVASKTLVQLQEIPSVKEELPNFDIDIDKLVKDITETVTKKLSADFE